MPLRHLSAAEIWRGQECSEAWRFLDHPSGLISYLCFWEVKIKTLPLIISVYFQIPIVQAGCGSYRACLSFPPSCQSWSTSSCQGMCLCTLHYSQTVVFGFVPYPVHPCTSLLKDICLFITPNTPLQDLQPQQVFAFLPLRSYGFRFIVQGDFDLPSSREDVNSDSAWNQWLREEIPYLFVEAMEKMKVHHFANN